MALKLANNATSTLANSITAGATSLSVASADASKFPTLGDGDWFPLTVVDAAGNMEIMKVTAREDEVFTVTRAQENTTARAFDAGSRVDLRMTAGAFNGSGSGLDADLLDGQHGSYYFNPSNVIGTVSQSEGVPTGALTEIGINANGIYVRFANGLQFCWRYAAPLTGISTGGSTHDQAFTPPAEFADAEYAPFAIIDRRGASWGASGDRQSLVTTSVLSETQFNVLLFRRGG